jgi:hypothetical protein
VWVAAAISWCGVSGCGGGGFGVSRNPVSTVLLTILAGAIVAIPVFAVPWTKSVRLRAICAGVVLVAAALLGLIAIIVIKG